jgi:hypothetical protein
MNWHLDSLRYLKDVPLAHHNFTKAVEEAEMLLFTAQPGEMLFIHGPTRVGKTYLSKELASRIYGSPNPLSDDVPFATVTAANASTAGSFSTRAFTRSALTAVRHPMYSNSRIEKTVAKFLSSLQRATEDEMRDQLVLAMQSRHTEILFLDEMQNTRFVKGGPTAASWFIDSLKCAAYDTSSKIVIIGTYELLPIRDLCSQVIGRSDTVHFPRYKCETLEDVCFWEQTLETYSKNIVFRRDSGSLRDWSERIHQLTFGCFGLLNKLLRSAIAYSKLTDCSYFALEHVELAKKDPREWDAVWRSIEFGEKYLADPESIDLEGLLGNLHKKKTPKKQSEGSKSKGKPFERNPRRYRQNDRMEG